MNTQMPIGVDDFKEVRENYYFVDKTHFIQSLIDGHSKVTLLTRPRRFGKTLTMSMLDYFFSLEREQEKNEITVKTIKEITKQNAIKEVAIVALIIIFLLIFYKYC